MRNIACVAIIQNKKVLLTKESGREIWTLPGGQIETGENSQQTIGREIAEELPDLKINDLKFYKKFCGHSPHQGDLISVDVYLATSNNKIETAAEVDQAEWLAYGTNYNLSEITKNIIDDLHQNNFL